MLKILLLIKRLMLFTLFLIIVAIMFNKYCGINPSTFDLFTIILLFGGIYIINNIYIWIQEIIKNTNLR